MLQSATLRVFGAALSCVLLRPDPAGADELLHELKLGVLSHDVPKLWSGFRREAPSADINIEAQLKPSLELAGGSVRPVAGGTFNTDGQTSHAYGDLRWTCDAPSGVFVSFGLGGAVHDGRTNAFDHRSKALGSVLLFHIPAEIGYRLDGHHSISAYFEHTSNANSQTFNEGLDRLGVRYGYLF